MKKILLTGGRSPACLELIRGFGKQDYEIYLAESLHVNLSKYSKYNSRFFRVEKPRLNPKKFIDDLVHIINNHHIDYLFPVCEEVFYISMYKNVLAEQCPHVKVLADDISTLNLLHNKYDFMQSCMTLDIQTPKTFYLDHEDKYSIYKAHFQDSFILKPVYSRFGSHIHILNKSDPLPKIDLSSENPWVMQAFIPGKLICSYSYFEDGNEKFTVVYTSHYSLGSGANINFKHIDIPEVHYAIQKIGAFHKYSGNISFDFIQSDSGIYMIECNPRITSGIHLLQKNNFSDLFFNTPKEPIRTQPAQLLVPMMIKGIREINPKSVAAFLKTIFTYKDVVFDFTDIKPFGAQFYEFIHLNQLANNTGQTIEQASTYDIEWNGHLNEL